MCSPTSTEQQAVEATKGSYNHNSNFTIADNDDGDKLQQNDKQLLLQQQQQQHHRRHERAQAIRTKFVVSGMILLYVVAWIMSLGRLIGTKFWDQK